MPSAVPLSSRAAVRAVASASACSSALRLYSMARSSAMPTMASMPSAMTQHRMAMTPRWRGRLVRCLVVSWQSWPFDFIHQEIFLIDAAQAGDSRLSVDTENHWMLYLIPDWERFQFVWHSP